jgi:hypothetical protein
MDGTTVRIGDETSGMHGRHGAGIDNSADRCVSTR